ncbi:MAG TPA: enoyl-CoA hydratase-related protein [Methylomirabilota bacterium]|nr:enoyl-CoA hydratase-related protein [Methylomirabilota bacterium]
MRVESAGISIVAIDGACTGADFERALEADIRVAADGATFSADGARDLAACAHRLTRLLGEARAKEIVLGPRRFDAATALRLGIVTRVVPAAELAATAAALVERLAALPPLALPAIRDAVRAARDLTPDAALAVEHAHFRRLIATRDHKAAVAAFFERRPAVFTGD